ncbi:probable beta-1,3-galactosyltransferase 14 [Cucurbita pepo subsp. pepo]|uniref:probable beta-1,3-galactosyltransferase 14 n=1 Tax=Cucurbita pepo subsp. pepo TaxID=3664 RepID=UPI000C9D697E|nr:probable beta-1,3-galactosyltransferase 14 [Cucurbita pepo subsp. pepo]
MPSSPKLFHARHSPTSPFYSRRSSVLLLVSCLLIGISGFIFGLTSFFSPRLRYNCSNRDPRTVKVVWDKAADSGGVFGAGTGGIGGDAKRHKVMGFVGIQTGFASVGRRQSLRKTWLPPDREGLQRLEEATGLAFRFIIGKSSDKRKMAELKKEVAEYDDFLLLDIEEEYSRLPYKTLAFFKAAYALYDSEFYVKADDDIYLRPDRLSLLLAKERTHPQTYIGCMKKGPVFTDPKLKWYEPLSHLLGNEYFLHAYGPIYILSADVVASLGALKNSSFRMFSNEDVTIGAWMLAMNVEHENNKALCEPDCSPTSIAVWDIPKCSGLCNPEKKLLELHNKESCTKSPTLPADDDSR